MSVPLHIAFTMNCDAPVRKSPNTSPDSWETSARSIEGFCDRVLASGYAATLFVSPRVAEEQEPLLSELLSRGVELALYLDPKHLDVSGFTHHLGRYDEQDQHDLIEHATEVFYEALGVRPRSFRGGDFSANDATFGVLYRLGYRQGSLSVPGRNIARHNALWRGADPDPHYIDPTDRLKSGVFEFLEVPVTSDALQPGSGGFAPDVCVEVGTFKDWHEPLIAGQLTRMANDEQRFRSLCVFTHNRFPYHKGDEKHTQTLAAMITYVDSLGADYTLTPATIAGMHEHWRALNRG